MSKDKFTESDLREELGPDGIDELTDTVPHYQRTERILEMSLPDSVPWNASILHAWAAFASVVLENVPNATISGMGSITRRKSREELTEIAIREELRKRNND